MTRQVLQRRASSTAARSHESSAFAPRGFGDALSRLPAAVPQAKLTVNQPGDKYEQEADAVADRVLRMGDTATAAREEVPEEEEVQAKPVAGSISPLVQREGDEEEDEEHKPVQAKSLPSAPGLVQRDPAPDEEDPAKNQASAPAPDAAQGHSEAQTPKAAGQEPDEEPVQTKALPGAAASLQRAGDGGAASPDVSGVVQQGLSGGGQALDAATRADMEPRFGHDFSQVRIHTDSRASQSSEAIAARAYTVGSDIAFRSGEFDPGTSDGRRLLAHELTHVVQQGAASAASADRMADTSAPIVSRSSGAVQRDSRLIPQPNWGSGGDSTVRIDPYAEVTGIGAAWFNGGKSLDTVTVPRDFSGAAKIHVTCYYNYHDKGSFLGKKEERKFGVLNAEASIGIKVEKGKLAFIGTPVPIGDNGVAGLIEFTKTAIAPSVAGDNDGSFGLIADFKATSAQTTSTTTTVGTSASHTTNTNAGVDVKAVSVGGGTSTQLGVSGSVAKADAVTTSGTSGEQGGFTLNVHVVDAPPVTKTTLPGQVFFAKSGSKTLDDKAPGVVVGMYSKLPEPVKDDIRAGKVRIYLYGYADGVGGNQKNFILSSERTKAVIKEFQVADPLLTDKSFLAYPRGEEFTKQDGKDAPEERLVDIRIEYENSPATATPAGGGPPKP